MKQFQIDIYNHRDEYSKELGVGVHLSDDELLKFARENILLYTEHNTVIKIYDKYNNTCLRANLMKGQEDLFGGSNG